MFTVLPVLVWGHHRLRRISIARTLREIVVKLMTPIKRLSGQTSNELFLRNWALITGSASQAAPKPSKDVPSPPSSTMPGPPAAMWQPSSEQAKNQQVSQNHWKNNPIQKKEWKCSPMESKEETQNVPKPKTFRGSLDVYPVCEPS